MHENFQRGKMAKKIFIGNYKGGVGKTTSTYQIALELQKRDYKVLLIDLDSQSSLSEVCITALGRRLDELPSNETLNYVYELYLQANKIHNIKFNLDTNIIVKSVHGIYFVPNSLFSTYGGLDRIAMDMDRNVENLLILRNFIKDNNLDSIYDFIFLDCPPSNNIITQMAFLYSDYYIIPTIMDALSARGVQHYISIVKKIYENYCKKNENSAIFSLLFGEEPKLIGIFETMRKGTTNTITYRNMFNSKDLFESEITHLIDIARSTGAGGNQTKEVGYNNLTDEMLKRIEKLKGVHY
jgi:cellulose biosynthesis protein BcsQ